MAAPLIGAVTRNLITRHICGLPKVVQPLIFVDVGSQVRNYALRKATRERKRKLWKRKKPLEEEVKLTFVQRLMKEKRDAMKIPTGPRRLDDSSKEASCDDVWIESFHKFRVYSFEEALECHRETHHPTMFNVPDAPVEITIELNMRSTKKTKCIDDFTRFVGMPHPFIRSIDRSILALSKSVDAQNAALAAGATVSGGMEIIKDIQSGKLGLEEFDFVVSHTDIYPEVLSLRGLLKRKLPNAKTGNLGPDMAYLVNKFLYGINYSSKSDVFEKDYASIDVPIGKLPMETSHLQDNLQTIVDDVMQMKPKREGSFITRIFMKSPPSPESLIVDLDPFLEKYEPKEEKESEEEAVAKSA